MRGTKEDEWWITTAGNDLDGWNALAFCKSLRMTLTTRKICIVVADTISKEMREILEASFDFVYGIGQISVSEKNNITSGILLQMSIWKCVFAKRAVYIHPGCLVLKNSDELFQLEQGFIVSQSVTGSSKLDLVGASIFVFNPSMSKFDEIALLLSKPEELKTMRAEGALNSNLLAEWPMASENKLGLEYSVNLNGNGSHNMLTLQTKIIRFSNERPWLLEFENGYQNPWLAMNSNGILPCAKKLNEKRFRKYIDLCLGKYKLPANVARECKAVHELLQSQLDDTISIVGLSCRFPGANNAEEFWELLVEGRDETKLMPPQRTIICGLESAEKGFNIPVGYLKCPIQDFDAKFFEISRREAEYMDPQQRLLLEVTWESLENAGINPLSLGGTNTAVFAGMWSQEYAMHLSSVDNSNQNFQYKYLGNSFCAASARVSHFLGLHGPSLTIESGCASALQGVHHACESLRNGQTDLAISCGVNVALGVSGELSALDSFIISKDGKCKTFDESADGFARGEACVSLILKRTPDARRDGNSILGIIRGSALNNDGGETALGTPSAFAQEEVLKAALRDSRISPSDVSYIEAHGTGTPVGDPTEFHALNRVFGKGRVKPLFVGSVKTNIGHTEGCSGLAGLVKVLLCMRNGVIPRHLHLKALNPYINLSEIPAIIPQESTKWEASSKHGLIAGVSSFGLSGTNVNVILQEPPSTSPLGIEFSKLDRTNHVLALSAKSETALEELTKSYISLIEENPGVKLADLAFSANTGRAHLRHRLGVIAQDTEQLLKRLKKRASQPGVTVSQKIKVAFLFTGQGSQYVEMAKTLYATQPHFRASFNNCSRLLMERYGIDLCEILGYCTPQSIAAGNNELNSSIYSQPAVFCVEVCLAQLWNSFGILPDVVLGHSVGEFAAAVAAGIISFDDGLKMVVERSKLVNKLESGSMAVVRASRPNVLKLIQEFSLDASIWIDIAAVNSDNEVVISGRSVAIQRFCDVCREKKVNTQLLLASHAFHSRDMDHVLSDYESIVKTITTGQNKCKYMSGTLAKEMGVNEFTTSYWLKHLREPVNFQAAFNALALENDCLALVEVGPQPVLLALGMASISPEVMADYLWCPTIRKGEDNWCTMLTSLAKMYAFGLEIDWCGFDAAYRRERLCIPNYPFQREQFWLESKSKSSESLSVNSKLVHPILGRRVPSPVAEKIMYHNSFSLDTLPYIRDHVVARKFVLPGAGYLELVLAAGRDIICGGTNAPIPLQVENLIIESALLLEEEQTVQIQTVVSSGVDDEDQLKYTVEIFKLIVFDPSGSDGGKWKRIVSATVIGSASLEPSANQVLDIESLQSRLALRESADDIYKKIAETGITFGPSFKSIHKCWYSEDELLVETSWPTGSDKYVCHPVVLDAMIQTYVASLLLKDRVTKGLYLPLCVGKFVNLPSNAFSSKLHIYSRRKSPGSAQQVVKLFVEGLQISSMENVEMIQTTIPAFLRLTNSEADKYPGFYEEVWHRHLGPWAKRVENLTVTKEIVESSVEITTFLSECYEKASQYQLLSVQLHELPYLYILKAIVQMGWSYRVGDIVVVTEFGRSSGVQDKHMKLLFRWFEILGEEGDLSLVNDDNEQFLVRRELPSQEIIETAIADLLSQIVAKKFDDVESRFVQHCGESLENVMKGKVSIYSVLFPDAAASLYRSQFITLVHLIPGLVIKTIFDSQIHKVKKDTVMRIIEVGAGTGSQTEVLLNQIKALNMKYEYTITDVSPLFLNEARKKFPWNKNLKYEIFDLEKDPLLQGFSFQYYDFVVADSVLHATENINTTLKNIIRLLKPEGWFIFNEQVNPFRMMDISFGFMEGWWRFNDYDLRKRSPILNKEAWFNVLASNGFTDATILAEMAGEIFVHRTFAARAPPSYEGKGIKESGHGSRLWLIFGSMEQFAPLVGRQLEKVGRRWKCVGMTSATSSSFINENFEVNPCVPEHFIELFAHLKERQEVVEGIVFLCGMMGSCSGEDEWYNCDAMCETNFALLHLLQALAVDRDATKLFVVTRGAQFVGEQEPINPIAATLWGMLMCFNNEFIEHRNILVDLDPSDELSTSAIDLFYFLWQNNSEFQVALRERNVYYKRLLPVEPYKQSLTFPNSVRYKLQNPPSGLFSDFIISPSVRPELQPNEVEVKMACTSLNFKDILLAMTSDDMAGTPLNLNIRNAVELGLDISGVVVSVGCEVKEFAIGDEVVGACGGGALASHIVVQETSLSRKPANSSIEEAALANVVLLTAYYFLVNKGELKRQDKVLIHTASGGVGLAAIQVAQDAGAELYVTAGSRRKRNYLRSLGIKYVYHSRNTDYESEIRRDTNGYGVDVVLNSLTGVGFKEATLSVCAPNARFLEMSKFNVWTKEEVASLRPDVFYFLQEINSVIEKTFDDGGAFGDEETATKMRELYISRIEDGRFTHIPYTLFPFSRCEDAFHYLQDAKQIGKVVIKIPETTLVNGKVVHKENFFNPNYSYLITGGMGGIGLEVAKWMASSGAQYLVLAGRSAPSARAESIIAAIRGTKVNVMVIQSDVSDCTECRRMLNQINDTYPPLKGIMHAAGVTSDNLLIKQNMASLMKAYKPKLHGTINLHVLTKSYNLEHFVLFSSAIATLGGFGQCNHAAANKYLDAFAQYRVECGLPCCSVNWGPWSDVGAAVGLEGIEGAFGIRMFTPSQGIASLERALFAHRTNTVVFDIADQRTMEQSYNLGNLLEFIKQKQEETTNSKEYEGRVKAILGAEPHVRREQVKEFIELILRDVLKLGENEPIDPDQDLREMGVDSLMGMEIRSRIQPLLTAFNTKALALNDVQENRTINKLTNLISDVLSKGASTKALTSEELLALAKSDSCLEEDIVPLKDYPSITEINSILLTGVTGLLGPHVLRELVNQRKGTKVICLIRAKSNEEARTRLELTLKEALMDNLMLEDVVCVAANVANRRFGLGEEVYDELTKSVHAIIHCAGSLNHFESYGQIGEGDIRSTNVLGLKHVLKFAATEKTKILLFPGHIWSCKRSDGSYPEEFPHVNDFGMSCWTKALQSKLICEKLLEQALDKGLPILLLRLHHLVGDSKTGMMDVTKNYTGMFVTTCVKLGMFPDYREAYMTGLASDTVANIMVQMVFRRGIEYGVYNINNPKVRRLVELHGVLEQRGMKLDFVSYNEWREAALLSFGGFDPLGEEFTKDFSKSVAMEYVFASSTTEGEKSLFNNSARIKRWIPNIDELMVDPIELAKAYFNYYDRVCSGEVSFRRAVSSSPIQH